MSCQMNVKDMISNIVIATEETLGFDGVQCRVLHRLQEVDSKIKTIAFYAGSGKEIAEKLNIKENSRTGAYEKYPAIVLITPFKQEGGKAGGYHSKATLKIGFITATNSDLMIEDRYTNSFDNILTPIYEAFLEAMVDSGYFAITSVRHIEHTKVINDQMGRNPFLNMEGITSDYLDAIEIPNMVLTVHDTRHAIKLI